MAAADQAAASFPGVHDHGSARFSITLAHALDTFHAAKYMDPRPLRE
jgi:hypothetical protein